MIIWDPHEVGLITEIRVQRRAARFVMDCYEKKEQRYLIVNYVRVGNLAGNTKKI